MFYTEAAPNQQAIPATDYFLGELCVEKICAAGHGVFSPARRKTIWSPICSKKASLRIYLSNYTQFGHSDWSKIVSDVVALGADGKKVGVISTINGDANVGFCKELAAIGISANEIPVVAFSVGEEELAGLDTSNHVGRLAAWSHFQSAKSEANDSWV